MAAMKMFGGMPPMPPMMMPGMMPPPGSVDKVTFDQLKTSMDEMTADIHTKYDSVLEYLQKLEERYTCIIYGCKNAKSSLCPLHYIHFIFCSEWTVHPVSSLQTKRMARKRLMVKVSSETMYCKIV
jgi:hypothetical protein